MKYIESRALFLFVMVVCISCTQDRDRGDEAYRNISGETMGTTYHITYRDSLSRSFQESVDSILHAINAEVSTYIDSSVISRFNRSDTGLFLERSGHPPKYPHFQKNWYLSGEVHAITNGYFDPSVMPLVNYWGFGYTPRQAMSQIDTAAVDSLLQFIGMDRIEKSIKSGTNRQFISKSRPELELDFGGIAKGYGVDEVAEFLELQAIEDYMVEIGGEVRCRGRSPGGGPWKIGINTPDPDASIRSVNTVLKLENGAVATSGNYRNYHEINGTLYGHTISPFTGFPELNTILSATVYASDCARADAYATAFMAMGVEKSISLAKNLKDIELLLIVSSGKNETKQVVTPGFEEILNENQ